MESGETPGESVTVESGETPGESVTVMLLRGEDKSDT